jgi:hypothetical protein
MRRASVDEMAALGALANERKARGGNVIPLRG